MRIAATTLAAVTLVTPSQGRDAVRLDPIDAILDAFKSHQVVTLAGAHGGVRHHELLLQIIRDPRTPGLITDLVVEFGTSRYQDMADRFVRGDTIPRDELKKIWQNTTNPGITHDTPHSEETLRAVRQLNAALPAERQLRVVLGEPPIDWDHIKRREDHRRWVVRRDTFVGDLIVRDVVERGRRALVIYGNLHFPRKEILTNYDMRDYQAQTLVSVIEAAGHKVFVLFGDSAGIEALQPGIKSWPPLSVLLVKGTRIGAADFAEINPVGTRYAILGPDRFEPLPKSSWTARRVDEQVDAIMYLGGAGPTAGLARETCADPAYVPMRMERMRLAGLPPEQAERVKRMCSDLLAAR